MFSRLASQVIFPSVSQLLKQVAAKPLVFALFVFAPSAQAASFDCMSATTAVEKRVCADPRLSSLDEQMAALYRQVLRQDPSAKFSQRDWLKFGRNRCMDSACLTSTYSARISQFRDGSYRDWAMKNMPEMAGVAASRPGISYFAAPANLAGIASWMKQTQVLEKNLEQAKTRYHYPANLKVVGKSCGTVNAFYSWESETIVVCYEIVDAIAKNYQVRGMQDGSSEQERLERFWLSLNFVAQHEFGHAALHNQRTPPSFGNPESEADNFSFVSLIDDITSSKKLSDLLFGVRYALDVFGQDTLTVENLADEHDLAQKRYLNFACLVSGASNHFSKIFLNNGTFPPLRIQKCQSEWRNRRTAMRILLSAQ